MSREVWLLGNPVLRSLSPAMQDAAFSALNLDCRYLPHELGTEALPEAIAEIRANANILGANVTIPHKKSVMPLLDELHPLAKRIRAVNTISRTDAGLVGFNTDVDGFRRALDVCGYTLDGGTAVIVGAGGAARAVAEALRMLAGRIVIVARNLQQAQQVITETELPAARALPLAANHDAVAGADLVVNATPADLPTLGVTVKRGQQVFDLRSRHSREGRAMLLHQGAASFAIWTGRQAPIDVMRAALERAAHAVTV